MRIESKSVGPPSFALWLVTLFSSADETETIVGDLLEEFSELASKLGVAFARRWFWRQSVGTITDVAVAGFRSAPFTMIGAVVGGSLLTGLFRFFQPAMTTVLDRLHLYENHPGAYIFFLSYGMLVGRIALYALIGIVVAVIAKGKEITATLVLSFIGTALTAAGFLFMMARNVHFWWGMIPWSFASQLAIVIGGAIVRMGRSVRIGGHSV